MENIILNEKNIWLPPGTAVYVGDRPPSALDISVITYNTEFAETKKISTIDEIPKCKDDGIIMWINLNGLEDIDSIKKLAAMYNIHSLTIEDVLNTKQQPKAEVFENYRFISFKSIRREKEFHENRYKQKRPLIFKFWEKTKAPVLGEEFLIEQISIIIVKNVIITFQEIPGDPFDGIRKRIFENLGFVRKMGSDYLAYALIDAVVDEYYLTLAHLEEDIENLEERAVRTNDDSFFSEIQDTKKYLLRIKHAMVPMRENLITLSRQDTQVPSDSLKPFLQDLRENLSNAIVTLENYREWLTNILDVNLSFLSHQMNKVMKILAIISSIFIPLTFIAGIYGMNFEFMPELGKPWAYPIVLCCMGFIASLMIIFFKIRRWF